jgi:hypothetical protein
MAADGRANRLACWLLVPSHHLVTPSPPLPLQYRRAYKELEAENRRLREKLGM